MQYLDHLLVMETISAASGSVGLSYGAQYVPSHLPLPLPPSY